MFLVFSDRYASELAVNFDYPAITMLACAFFEPIIKSWVSFSKCPSKKGVLSEREVCDSPKFGNKRRIAWPGPLSPAWIMTGAGNAIQVI